MKNNIDFYKHYSNADQHPKFKMLRVEYGWSGEGKFWALNNRIALADNCLLDIKKKYNKSGLASDLNLSLDEFDKFISFLLKECELIIEESPGIITTDIIQETLSKVINKRKVNQADYKDRLKESVRNTQTSGNEIQTSENIHSTSTSTSTSTVEKDYPLNLKKFTEDFYKYIKKTTPQKLPSGKNLIESSLDTLDKLIRLDGFKEDYILKIIRWAKNDDFWSDQIYSLAGLRVKNDSGLTKFQNMAIKYDKKFKNTSEHDPRLVNNALACKRFIEKKTAEMEDEDGKNRLR